VLCEVGFILHGSVTVSCEVAFFFHPPNEIEAFHDGKVKPVSQFSEKSWVMALELLVRKTAYRNKN